MSPSLDCPTKHSIIIFLEDILPFLALSLLDDIKDHLDILLISRALLAPYSFLIFMTRVQIFVIVIVGDYGIRSEKSICVISILFIILLNFILIILNQVIIISIVIVLI